MPKALVGPVLAMGRGPTRPPIEAFLVREAVADAPPGAPREPLARELAQRVVEELSAYLAEGEDPLLAALGDARRKVCPSPVATLATDPNVDTVALFVGERMDRLSARCGRGLSPVADQTECREILSGIAVKLTGRYLRHLRDR